MNTSIERKEKKYGEANVRVENLSYTDARRVCLHIRQAAKGSHKTTFYDVKYFGIIFFSLRMRRSILCPTKRKDF